MAPAPHPLPLHLPPSGSAANCLWSVTACEPTQAAAYVGDDGLIALTHMHIHANNKKRMPHAALGAIAVEGGEAWILRAQDIPGNGGLFPGGPHMRPEQLQAVSGAGAGAALALLDPRQALYMARFSGRYQEGAWLAVGGGAGLVRLMRVSAEAVAPTSEQVLCRKGRPPKARPRGRR